MMWLMAFNTVMRTLNYQQMTMSKQTLIVIVTVSNLMTNARVY